MNARTHAELAGFIWGICNLLRGPYKRNEYRKVILPLTVLRRFDCVLADTKEAVLDADAKHSAHSDNVRRQLLEDASGRPFYNTSPLDFPRLLNDPNQLAQNLNAYIGGFSANVREIMERFGFGEQIARMDERNLLFQVVQKFAGLDLSPARVDNMQMGYVFEELIRIGAEQANEEAGEHFTPREVIRLMVDLLLSPEPDLGKGYVVKTIYDPACGTGNFCRKMMSYPISCCYGKRACGKRVGTVPSRRWRAFRAVGAEAARRLGGSRACTRDPSRPAVPAAARRGAGPGCSALLQ